MSGIMYHRFLSSQPWNHVPLVVIMQYPAAMQPARKIR